MGDLFLDQCTVAAGLKMTSRTHENTLPIFNRSVCFTGWRDLGVIHTRINVRDSFRSPSTIAHAHKTQHMTQAQKDTDSSQSQVRNAWLTQSPNTNTIGHSARNVRRNSTRCGHPTKEATADTSTTKATAVLLSGYIPSPRKPAQKPPRWSPRPILPLLRYSYTIHPAIVRILPLPPRPSPLHHPSNSTRFREEMYGTVPVLACIPGSHSKISGIHDGHGQYIATNVSRMTPRMQYQVDCSLDDLHFLRHTRVHHVF